MLTIWGRADSSNVQAVMWCVGELNLPHTRLDVGERFGGNTTPEFRAMNPNGTIPVLQDGTETPIWESGAILRYLAGRYAPEVFWPATPSERVVVDQWAEWAKINIALAFTAPIFWRLVRTRAELRDQPAIDAAVKTLTRALSIAEAQLAKHPYLACDTLTLADIQFGHILFRYFDIAIDRSPMPNLTAYYHRLTQRPAFRQHVMVSYDALRA